MVPAGHEKPHPPTFRRCECVLHLDILENVERGLKGLTKAPKVSSSPFTGLEDKDVWTTQGDDFLAHLRHVTLRKPSSWSFRVVSDAELVTAWLASIALKGGDILDADALKISTRFITVPDLVVPPDLLIIRMGVKQARNQAAPEVLAEALNTRMHEGKPTWIWDEPHHPLNSGHLFWSDAVARILSRYQRPGEAKGAPTTSSKTPSGRKKVRKTLRGNNQ